MAKMFYSAEEAAERLGKTEEQLKDLVRGGKLREFRDAGTVNYKIDDVDAMAGPAVADIEESDDAGGSGSGDIVLEPAEDSSIAISPSGSDVISLEETDAEASAAGVTTAAAKAKDSTVVPSVGVNVFDDDELDEQVDPLAQTAVTDVAGLGLEGTGSGSGILDLTRESDDTSLGQELLDEIYTGEGETEATVEMGDDTRAGLEAAIPAEEATEPEEAFEVEEETESETEAEPVAAQKRRAVVKEVVVEYGPDAVSTSLTALMVVAVVVMWFAGLGAAALVRGITPALLQTIYANLWIYAAGALVAGAVAAAITFFVVKKRSE